jgi:hypothetical protein
MGIAPKGDLSIQFSVVLAKLVILLTRPALPTLIDWSAAVEASVVIVVVF